MQLTFDTPPSASMVGLYEKIYLFGDSIFQFSEDQQLGFAFAPAVRNDYVRRLDVENRGLSGYNTDLALRVLARVMPSPAHESVRMLVIFLGANDSCFYMPEDNQCVPLPQFMENLIKIIKHPSVEAHRPRILLINPPPIDENRQFLVDQAKGYGRRRTAENTKKYADAVLKVGADMGIPVVDMWTACAAKAGWQPGNALPGTEAGGNPPAFHDLFTDGLHLSPAGYKILYAEFCKSVREHYKELIPEALPSILPDWKLGVKSI